ncbi:hypothetical protein [Pseudomonas sp.]|uniref:hypothetical protein n=1 Tax=Pseudomonas sp. TaxID=306 RepID=UPI00260F3D30|nr:hypothetical protein [Pseudomonas sp.]
MIYQITDYPKQYAHGSVYRIIPYVSGFSVDVLMPTDIHEKLLLGYGEDVSEWVQYVLDVMSTEAKERHLNPESVIRFGYRVDEHKETIDQFAQLYLKKLEQFRFVYLLRGD